MAQPEAEVVKWIRVETSIADDPRVTRLSRTLEVCQSHAVGIVVRLWTWAARHAQDGCLHPWSPAEIGAMAAGTLNPVAVHNALAESGLIRHDEQGKAWVIGAEKLYGAAPVEVVPIEGGELLAAFKGTPFASIPNLGTFASRCLSAYPSVDLPVETRKAAAWVAANPAKAKKNWARFLNAWYSRASQGAAKKRVRVPSVLSAAMPPPIPMSRMTVDEYTEFVNATDGSKDDKEAWIKMARRGDVALVTRCS